MKILLTLLMLGSMLFASKADFLHDYKQAIEIAKKENKDIYMLITSTSCQWCRKFEAKTLSNPDIIKLLKKDFVLLALTRDVDYIPSQYKAKRVPKHYFLTSKGEVIYAFLGYWSSEDFTSFIEDVKKKK